MVAGALVQGGTGAAIPIEAVSEGTGTRGGTDAAIVGRTDGAEQMRWQRWRRGGNRQQGNTLSDNAKPRSGGRGVPPPTVVRLAQFACGLGSSLVDESASCG
jgi:hypothetical protein